MIGTLLNHYRIVAAIGSGGMGDVYEAEDTRLHRRVALKVLAPAVADDPGRRERFEREARAVAALSHPNIVTIYSIEQAGDRPFLTMELVRGRTLSRLIPARGVALAQLLQFAIPLADALSAAHREGVVHRDLKPDNIMVAEDGRVRILDFGLAQLKEVGPSGDGTTIAGTGQLTAEGLVLGTVSYMSPEQAQGLPVDARSDLFSLGIVLYEMATGERPFKGDNPISVLSSIVKDPAPGLATVNSAHPSELARIIRRSLAKEPARRYQTATDIRNDLEDLQQLTASGQSAAIGPAGARAGWRAREAIAWAAAVAMLIVTLVVLFGRERSPDPGSDVLSMLPPENTTLTEGEAPQVSPDGQVIAFVATDNSGRTLLYVRQRGRVDAHALAETDDASQPFWSPDSRAIGFFAGGRLKKVALAGGRPQTLAAAPVPRGGTWNRNDVIVFVPFPEQPPHQVSAAGGAVTALPARPGELRWFPSFLSDGARYVYLAMGASQSQGLHVGSLDRPDATLLAPSNASAAYVDSGHLLFRREESLVVQRLNAGALQLDGAPVVLADQVSFNPITQQTLSSASSHGMLAYLRGGQVWNLTWFDSSGRRLSQAGTIGGYNSLCLSADGRRVVYDVADTKSGNVDLWALDFTDGTTTRLTFHPAADFYVACSPSGDEVIFSSPRKGTPNLYRLSLSSPGDEAFLGESALPMLPTQWARNGRLLFAAFSPKTDFDVWIQPLPGGEAVRVIATEAPDKGGQLSPNGRWISYASAQSGRSEVYVQRSDESKSGSRWQISRDGGRQPQWRPDGRQLYYISNDNKLVAVDVDSAAPRFAVGPSRMLIDTRVGGWERTHLGNPYAVSADGQRLLVANAAEAPLPVTVILNWRGMAPGGAR